MNHLPWKRFQQFITPGNQEHDAEPAVSAIYNVGLLTLCNTCSLGNANAADSFAWFMFFHKTLSIRLCRAKWPDCSPPNRETETKTHRWLRCLRMLLINRSWTRPPFPSRSGCRRGIGLRAEIPVMFSSKLE